MVIFTYFNIKVRYTGVNMKKILLLSSTFLLLPFLSLAASTSTSLQSFLTTIPLFLNKVIIPFLFGIAFLIFVINVIRYFVLGAGNEKERDKAKALAIYGVAAFVFLIIVFGIINLLVSSSGLGGQNAPCPDYKKAFDTCP